MENITEALSIMGRGLLVVFGVMGLITLVIYGMGRYFIAEAEKEKARKKEEAEAKKAEEAKAKEAEEARAGEAEAEEPKADKEADTDDKEKA